MDERKLKILNSIIKSYTESGEPVGSRTLSKDQEIGVSAATIRNEMSDLEDLGYLEKVHSSSGRIPSNRGYRRYVDALLSDEIPFRQSGNELFDARRLERSNELEAVLSNGIKMLSAITNYASFVVVPELEDIYLKYINAVMLSPKDLVIIYIYNSKTVKSDVIRLKSAVNQEVVNLLNSILNASLIDLNPKQILEKIESPMFQVLRSQNQTLDYILPTLKAKFEEASKASINFEGIGNIYNFNEGDFKQNQKIIDQIRDDNPLKDLLSYNGGRELQIYIGDEIGLEGYENFSMITMKFTDNKGIKGKIGVLGPNSMIYDKVISDLLIVTRYIKSSLVEKG